MQPSPDLLEALALVPLAQELWRSGAPQEKILVELARQNVLLMNRITDLEAIAPRAYKIGKQLFVYRCPDNLVPRTALTILLPSEKANEKE